MKNASLLSLAVCALFAGALSVNTADAAPKHQQDPRKEQTWGQPARGPQVQTGQKPHTPKHQAPAPKHSPKVQPKHQSPAPKYQPQQKKQVTPQKHQPKSPQKAQHPKPGNGQKHMPQPSANKPKPSPAPTPNKPKPGKGPQKPTATGSNFGAGTNLGNYNHDCKLNNSGAKTNSEIDENKGIDKLIKSGTWKGSDRF